jgi:hypothetical protein
MKLTDTCGFKRNKELCIELVYLLSCSVSLCAARLAMSLLGVELKLSTRGIAVHVPHLRAWSPVHAEAPR